MTIRVEGREEPSTTDPFVLSFRHARRGVLEAMAKRAFLTYSAYGEVGADGFSARARTPREKGKIARFLVEAKQNHLLPYLAVSCETDEEREMLLGLGLRNADLDPCPPTAGHGSRRP